MTASARHIQAVYAAWAAFGDPRTIVHLNEVSANVSTNRVYRVHLDDGTTLVSKVSTYGSYFLFVEDHDRLHRCANLLANGGNRLPQSIDLPRVVAVLAQQECASLPRFKIDQDRPVLEKNALGPQLGAAANLLFLHQQFIPGRR